MNARVFLGGLLGGLLATFACSRAFAEAPGTLEGRVFRDYGRQNVGVIATFIYWESTITLANDGSYRYLLNGAGSDLSPTARGKILVQTPLPDGTYTYTRIDDTRATLVLHEPSGSLPRGGARTTLNLTFTSDNAGFVNGLSGANGSLVVHRFSLSGPMNREAARAKNISLRGHVAPGSPLIAGLVIPGAGEREVLIRVVGPSLSAFGIAAPRRDPDFQLFRGPDLAILNEAHLGDWSTGNVPGLRRIFDFVGAFPLPSDSKDAADVVRLSPGLYTIVCTAPAGDPGGEALIEVYFLP